MSSLRITANGPQVAEGGYSQTLKRSTDMDNETNIPDEEQTGRLQQPAVMGSAFEPVHCQKDYLTDTVTVQFRGQFNGVKAWEYLKQSYPSFEGREIVYFEEPSNFRGLENLGTAVFQHCP